MTTDTTMTEVDTSKIAVINIVSALTHMMEKSGGASVEREVLRLAIEKIEALAAERDELERLAGEVGNDLRNLQGWTKELLLYRTGKPEQHGAYSDDDIRAALHKSQDNLAALKAYQRKGE